MLISKTMFKEYSRCPRVCALDNIYQQKANSEVSFFNSDNAENLSSMLSQMFTEEGDDLIFTINEKQEALLEYYDNVEKYAMKFASQKFNIPIHHAKETSKQKRFSYQDEEGNEFYCYVDGYYENEEEIYIFEVKATTVNKFLELGPKKKNSPKHAKGLNKHYSIFEFNESSILTLKQNIDQKELTIKQYETNYQKLFNRYSDCGKYLYDFAIERHIIENSLQNSDKPKRIYYYLVVLNSDYIFDGTYDENGPVYKTDQNNEELFIIIDVDQITREYQSKVSKIKEKLINDLKNLDPSPYPIGVYCERKKQSGCPFVSICWDNVLQKGSILEYTYNHQGFKDKNGKTHHIFDLINQGYTQLDSIPKSWLSRQENQIQRECYDMNKEYIDYEKITAGLSLIKYPIYHLDFETFASPLPRFQGEVPYMQSVFQFSVHIEKSPGQCNLIEDNYYYLSKNHFDNRQELVEKLINIIDLSNGGTVLVYNKNFEYSRISELSGLFPQYKEKLKKINEHMFDLYDIVRGNLRIYHTQLGFSKEESKIFNYYHPAQVGSFSIKNLLPNFSNLSYDELNVANGSDALATYASYHLYEEEDLEDIYADLIKYCRLDTWAMVVILDGIRQLVK